VAEFAGFEPEIDSRTAKDAPWRESISSLSLQEIHSIGLAKQDKLRKRLKIRS
jgi:hypothetical protein